MKMLQNGILGEINMTNTNDMKNVKNKYKLVCGLEVHAELKTKSKMFCGCKNDPFNAPAPNTYTCPVCLGMPGGTPVANKSAIEWVIKVGLALGCKINLFSKFDRKNYFYPDLPKAYQISQYDLPFCYDGVIETSFGPVRITRIHLEEDTGKLQHKEIDGKNVSLIDFNRSSVPLMEIVTEPDIKSAEQAKEYGKNLRALLRYLDVADCDMEQGGMRLEANTSLALADATNLPNYKVEVKNINSFRFLEQAINYEMKRQEEILEEGQTPIQETRGFNPNKGTTFSQRTKEDAEDYRYFPDPDLPPIVFTKEQIEKMRSELPELKLEKLARWQKEFAVEPRFSDLLFEKQEEANFYEELFKKALIEKIDNNKLASAIVNKKFNCEIGEMSENEISQIINEFKKLFATDDVNKDEIVTAIQSVMAENQDAVAKYKNGETKVIGFFMGQVMRKIAKKVDNKIINEVLIAELSK